MSVIENNGVKSKRKGEDARGEIAILRHLSVSLRRATYASIFLQC